MVKKVINEENGEILHKIENEEEQRTLKVTAGLHGSTEIFAEESFNKISSVYNMYAGPFNTFSIGSDLTPSMTKTVLVPAIANAKNWYVIKLSNGLMIKCGPSTMFLTSVDKRYIVVEQLKVGTELCEVTYDISSNNIIIGKTTIELIEFVESPIGEPAYYFINETKNMMLPAYNKDKNTISFVNIMQ